MSEHVAEVADAHAIGFPAPEPPPFRPDPDLIDNAEGNQRIKAKDKAAAEAFLAAAPETEGRTCVSCGAPVHGYRTNRLCPDCHADAFEGGGDIG